MIRLLRDVMWCLVSQVRVLVKLPLAEGVRLPGELLLLAVRGSRLAHQPHGAALLQQTQRGRVRPSSTCVPDGGGWGGSRGRAGSIVQLIHGLRHRGQGGRGGIGVQVRGGAKERCLVQSVGVRCACGRIRGLPSQRSSPWPVVRGHHRLLDLHKEDVQGQIMRWYRQHDICRLKKCRGQQLECCFWHRNSLSNFSKDELCIVTKRWHLGKTYQVHQSEKEPA